jgi:FkbH-like protein
MKNIFVFRNYTVEPLFTNSNEFNFQFSNYNDCHNIPNNFDLYFWFFQVPIKNNIQKLNEEILNFSFYIDHLIENIDKNSFLIISKLRKNYQIELNYTDFTLSDAINDFNNKIESLTKNNPNIILFDIENVFINLKHPITDWKYFYVSQMYFNPKNAFILGTRIIDFISSLIFPRKKCIVLDMDNTLWGGILGEDGIDGIKLNNIYPGLAYLDFQELIVESSKYGVIIAVLSKNNIEDVKLVWENHHSILLKPEYISSYRINWMPKSDNIVELANELNIGLDSFVFIDDNPVERDLMRVAHPQVVVPDFPANPYELRNFFLELINKYFIRYRLTNEDLNKTKQYQEQVLRESLKSIYSDKQSYFMSLEMKLKVSILDNHNIIRASQMTQKTNQFNLTTKRYDELQLKKLIETDNLVFTLSVSDKFGDSGITGLIILKKNGMTAIIDTYLLSCRILGRSIEIAFLKFVINKLYNEYNIRYISSEYIQSTKNVQTKNFYESLNFTLIKETTEKKEYHLSIESNFEIENYFNFLD